MKKKPIIILTLFVGIVAMFIAVRIIASNVMGEKFTFLPSDIEVKKTNMGLAGALSGSSDSGEPDINTEDEWHGPIVPIAEYDGEMPRIICWGDSLTQSVDAKTSYPDVLADISGATVVNYGVSSETTRMIAMREGAVPVYVDPVRIPATCDGVSVKLSTDTGGSVNFLKNGTDAGVNPCYIGGIRGNLSYSDGYIFTRIDAGDEAKVSKKSELITQGTANRKEGDVLVIFTGTNDALSYDTVSDLISLQRKMLSDADCDKYVVVGLTYKSGIPDISKVNAALSAEYKEHFLDIRSYLLQYGLLDAGIEPTDEDAGDIEAGEIPTSLRRDKVHGNEKFYDLLARQVYRKMQILGYLPLDEASAEAGKQNNSDTRIVCWGDSLTEGTGGNGVSYPSVLAELSGATVLNYGVYAERASLIAARQGGNPQHTQDLSTIPATCDPVKVNVVGDNGAWEMWCNFGDAGINPCQIAGVEGTLSIDGNDGTRYFTRNEPGDEVAVSDGEPFYTHAMLDKKDRDILVIWSGSSDGWFEDRSIDDIIAYQKSMLENANCERYVIINYTAKPNIGEEIDAWNERLASEYKEHCLDIRGYLLTSGLEDAGITATAQDKEDIKNGQIPTSLRSDESHGTADFYRIVGEQVYKKMKELGYLK